MSEPHGAAYAGLPMDMDPAALLDLLRDPNAESRQIAEASGASREEAGRAARLVHAIARAKPEEVATLPAALALAVLRAAVAAGRADLLAAAGASPSKEVAKEAKRALHLLRSRGVAVPEVPRQAPAPPPAAAEPETPCYASSVDGQGERAVWLARTVAGKGVELAQAILSDEQGLVSLQVGLLGRKEYRAFAQDLLARGGSLGVAEIPRALGHSLVDDARQLTQAADRPLPEGAAAWLAKLGPAQPLPDPALRFAPLPEPEERALVAASGRLHDLPLLRGWLAEEAPLRALAARLDEIAASPIVLDEKQRQEQVDRSVDAAIQAYFDTAQRSRWARRLLRVAGHLADAGDAESAQGAAATARALAAGQPAPEIPFARMLLEKALPRAHGAPATEGAPLPPPLFQTTARP